MLFEWVTLLVVLAALAAGFAFIHRHVGQMAPGPLAEAGLAESEVWRGSFLRFQTDEEVGPRTIGPVAAEWDDPRLRALEARLVQAWDAVRAASPTELSGAPWKVATFAAKELRRWRVVPDFAARFEALEARLDPRSRGDGPAFDGWRQLAVEELKGLLYTLSANIRGVVTGSGEAPRAMVEVTPDALRELVRAHAYVARQTLTEAERARWKERRAELSRELALYLARPLETAAAVVWRINMGSLGQLRSAMQRGPGWLKDRYGEEERRRLDAYAEAHVDVLCALAGRRSE